MRYDGGWRLEAASKKSKLKRTIEWVWVWEKQKKGAAEMCVCVCSNCLAGWLEFAQLAIEMGSMSYNKKKIVEQLLKSLSTLFMAQCFRAQRSHSKAIQAFAGFRRSDVTSNSSTA